MFISHDSLVVIVQVIVNHKVIDDVVVIRHNFRKMSLCVSMSNVYLCIVGPLVNQSAKFFVVQI